MTDFLAEMLRKRPWYIEARCVVRSWLATTFNYRRIIWWWQRRTRGFDDTETWSLDWTIAKFVAPRLRHLKATQHGWPGREFSSVEDWYIALDDMIYAMDAIANGAGWNDEYDHDRVQRGCDLFGKYFQALWD